MAPVDRGAVAQKLIRLDRVIAELQDIGKTSRKDFVRNERLQAATERYFILGIEIITDIGNHLLVELAGKGGHSYESIIEDLGRAGLVSPALAKRNAGMARFRNLLVHVYEVTEPELVYGYLKKAPKEFRAFAKSFSRHLKG